MKTAVITGGSGAIGEATAELFLKKGYNVAISYYSAKDKAKAFASRHENCVALSLDITDTKSIASFFANIRYCFGEIDVLINNAGVSITSLFQDFTDEDYSLIFDTNLKGAIYCTKEVLPSMISRKSGSIVNVSSIWGIVGGALEVLYSASKGGLIAFTKALAKEVGPSNVTVNCVAPGLVESPINSGLSSEDIDSFIEEQPLSHRGVPFDIARAIYYISTDKFTTGQILSPNGGAVIF